MNNVVYLNRSDLLEYAITSPADLKMTDWSMNEAEVPNS